MLLNLIIFYVVLLSATQQRVHNNTLDGIVNVFEDLDQCYNETLVHSTLKSKSFKNYDQTRACADRLASLDNNQQFPQCKPGLIDLSITPTISKNVGLYASLNISVTTYDLTVDKIFFRINCVKSSGPGDPYCKNEILNNPSERPCRALEIEKSHKMYPPLRYSYKCFAAIPFSVHSYNFTVFPQMCQSSIVLSTPRITDLFGQDFELSHMNPESFNRYTTPNWAPIIMAEFNDVEDVWIRLGVPPKAYCDRIEVIVFRNENGKDQPVPIKKFSLDCPKTAVKWENVAQGNYTILAVVVLPTCKAYCEPDDLDCLPCSQTRLELEIPYDRFGSTRDREFTNIFLAASFIIVLLAVLAIVAFFYKYYKKLRCCAIEIDSREIQLTSIIKTMLVYCNECEEHYKMALVIADCLKFYSNCDVIIDDQVLSLSSNSEPSTWLFQEFDRAEKRVILVSPIVVKMLDEEENRNHRLISTKPFKDMFYATMNMIFARYILDPEQVKKECCVILVPYSPPIPKKISDLGLKTFRLPEQFPELTAFIHNYADDSKRYKVNYQLQPQLLEQFTKQVELMNELMVKVPDWISRKWVPRSPAPVLRIPDASEDERKIEGGFESCENAALLPGVRLLGRDEVEEEDGDEESLKGCVLYGRDSDSDEE